MLQKTHFFFTEPTGLGRCSQLTQWNLISVASFSQKLLWTTEVQYQCWLGYPAMNSDSIPIPDDKTLMFRRKRFLINIYIHILNFQRLYLITESCQYVCKYCKKMHPSSVPTTKALLQHSRRYEESTNLSSWLPWQVHPGSLQTLSKCCCCPWQGWPACHGQGKIMIFS